MPQRKKKIRKIPPGRLFGTARRLANKFTLEETCLKTGLPLSWLRKFRQGEIPAPSVQRVECLIVTLTGKNLTIN